MTAIAPPGTAGAQFLRADFVRLPHVEPYAAAHGMAANAYAFLHPDGAVLVDAPFRDLAPALRGLRDRGHRPAALVLTHRHVAAQADAFVEVVEEFGVPVFLHPLDAAHPQGRAAARAARVVFGDPTTSRLLADLGVEVLFFPGHTEGHVTLYRADGGGVLAAGDAAMGASADDVAAGRSGLVRAPVGLSVDDARTRAGWAAFDRPLSTVGPYHGAPIVKQPDVARLALASLRRMKASTGVGLGPPADS